MTTKTHSWLSGVSMTAMERAQGRFLRAPDHDSGTADAAPAAPAAPTPAPAPAPEQSPEAVNTATEEALAAEFGDVDAATSEAEDGDEGGEQEPQEPEPGENSVQKRIDEAVRAQREAERDAAEARRELARLNAERPEAPKAEEGIDPDQAPDPEKYEFGEADPAYTADVAKFHARQEFARLQSEQAIKVEIAEMETKWQTQLADPTTTEKYPDFAEVVTKGADAGTWDCSPLMAVGIKQSPVGADVAYHLATNAPEAARIARLSPLEQALEFGRIEGRFMAAPKAEKTPVKPTQAPPPPASRSRGAGGKFATEADTEDFGSFSAMADGILKS